MSSIEQNPVSNNREGSGNQEKLRVDRGDLFRAALMAAFMSLGTPSALAQESTQEQETPTNVSGTIAVQSADTIPTNMIVDEDPIARGNIRVDTLIGEYTAAFEGQIDLNLREGEFSDAQIGACVERVYGELFAKGCLRQDVDLRTFSATTQQAVGVLANDLGVIVAGDYNLQDGDHGQYIEAGHAFNFTLGDRQITLTPMVGHEPQDNYDYGYVTMTMPLNVGGADLSFRAYGDENGRVDGSIALSVPFGRNN